MDIEIVIPQHQVPDTDCPDPEYGPFHMWSCDGPFTVSCDNCNADGVIVQTSEPGVEFDGEEEEDCGG